MRITQPDTDATAVTGKVALEVPCTTFTLALIAPCGESDNAGFELVRSTDRFPTDCDKVTVHVAAELRGIFVGVHARDDSVGVDQSDTVACREDAPTVTVTTA